MSPNQDSKSNSQEPKSLLPNSIIPMERPEDNLSKGRKVLIATFLVLCNSVLVSLNSCESDLGLREQGGNRKSEKRRGR